MPAPTIAELIIGDDPAAWERLGFAVDGDRTTVGATTIVLDGAGGGLRSWTLRDVPSIELDGLDTATSDAAPPAPREHPNGAVRIDHVVVNTPDLARTFGALAEAELDLRRVREHSDTVHQGFFRMGEVILEVVAPVIDGPAAPDAPGPSQSDPARFWGMVFVVEDLDRCAALLGDHLGAPRDAVQPGRRIATLRRSAGLSVPVAFITPAPARVS